MPSIPSRLAALERKLAPKPDAPFRRAVQPDRMPAAERRAWWDAQRARPGRCIARRPIPWPPETVDEVADLVEQGFDPASLLVRVQAIGTERGIAAVRMFLTRRMASPDRT